MASDVTFSSGQRLSSSPRSGDVSVDTGSVTVSPPTPVPHEVLAPGTSLQSSYAVANALGGFAEFFGQMAIRDKQKEVKQAQEENAQEIARLEAEVAKNPDGARAAIVSGDYSAFIPNDELRRRKVIARGFQSMVAHQMATEDFNSEVKAKIDATPLDGDPTAALQAHYQDALKGSEPWFEQAYVRTMDKLAGQEVDAFREKRQELLQLEAERHATALVNDALTNQEVPATLEGYHALRNKIVGGLPTNSPTAVVRTDTILARELLRRAAEGDRLAMKLVNLHDPAKDGRSIMEMNKALAEKVWAEHRKNLHEVRSKAADRDLEGFKDRIANIQLGDPNDSAAALWVDLQLHKERYGKSDAWNSIRDKTVQLLKAKGVALGAARRIAKGLDPNLSDAEWNKMAPSIVDGSLQKQIENEGFSPQVAQRLIAVAVARRGSPKKLKDISSSVLSSGPNAEEAKRTYETLKVLKSETKGSMEAHLHKTEVALFEAMKSVEDSGGDPMRFRADFMRAQTENRGANPLTFYSDQLASERKRSLMPTNVTTVSKEAEKTYEEMTADALQVPGTFFGTKLPKYSRVTQAAKRRIEEHLEVAAMVASVRPNDAASIRALAAKTLQGQLTVNKDADGYYVGIDYSPKTAVAPDGKIVPAQPVTHETHDRAEEYLKSDEAKDIMAIVDGYGGTEADPKTYAGQGLSVRSGEGMPITMRPGYRFSMPISQLPPDIGPLSKFLTVVERNEKADRITFQAMGPPPEGTSPRLFLKGRMFMLYDRDTGLWEMRVRDMMEGVDLNDVNAQSHANRQAPFVVPEGSSASRARQTMDRANISANKREDVINAPSPPPAPLSIQRPATRPTGQLWRHGAPVGAPAPDPDYTPTPSDEENQSYRDVIDEALGEFAARGITTPEAQQIEENTTGDVQGSFEDKLNARTNNVMMQTKSLGSWLNDVTKPVSDKFKHEMVRHIVGAEGPGPVVYDDYTGRPWGPKSRGNPTVGYGFNLNRPDAKDKLAQVGADYDKVLKGQPITEPQARKLLDLTIRDTTNYLRSKLQGVEMPQLAWQALISLAYNNPSLVGNNLVSFLKKGEWAKAADEIEFRSNKRTGAMPASIHRVLQARREEEADMLRRAFNIL